MALKQITLWSFLTQSNAKREIVCPDDLQVTIEDFAVELKTQLDYNRLPATAELARVNWDNTNTTQKLILIRYTDGQSSTDILQFAVSLEQLGRFVYLEKKSYLNPPQLPPKLKIKFPRQYIPQEVENEIEDSRNGSTILAEISVIVALLGLSLFTVGEVPFFLLGSFFLGVAILLFVIVKRMRVENLTIQENKNHHIEIAQQNQKIRQENAEIEQWNQQKQKRDHERQELIDRWFRDTVEVAYLSNVNDVFGRWTSAVSTTIDQVVQKLFVDRHAQAQQWDEDRKSKEQLLQELKAREEALY